jgi:cob(I)alamin adenosyltransferase
MIRQFRFPHISLAIFVVARTDSTFILEEMSIITQRGDDGMTDLMFGRRISKTSSRFTALGSIDELNAAIGLSRAADAEGKHTEILDRLQNLLFGLMGQLACLPEDQEKYLEKGYSAVKSEDLEWLTQTAKGIEDVGVKFTHWAVPGAEGSMARAHLDHARTVSRRAERDVLLLHKDGGQVPEVVRVFLNRISDLMWILARSEG